MKSITLKLSFLSIFLLSTIMFSCKEDPNIQKENEIEILESTGSNPFDIYGIHHNAELDLYLDDYRFDVTNRVIIDNGNYYISDSCLTNIIDACEEYCNTQGYTQTQIDNTIDSIISFFTDHNLIIEINNEDVLKNIYNELDDIFDALLTDNIIDSTSYDAFELIYSSIENGNSLAYNQAIIDSLELSLHPNYSNAQLSTFISIWNSSSEYWDDYPAPQGLNDNQKLIIADASGSLFGSLWGGVGAIVFGAIASCAEAEAQERGNSNWDWDNPFGL